MVSLLHISQALTVLEQRSFDFRAKVSESTRHAHKDIVLILIDDHAINSLNPLLGRWPWPRYIYAELLDFLTASNAAGIVMDILFTENQRNDSLLTTGSDDDAFVLATQSSPVIHSFQLAIDKLVTKENTSHPIYFPKPISDQYKLPLESKEIPTAHDFFLPFFQLALAATQLGFVDIDVDSDGIIRHSDLLRQYNQEAYPSLGLAAAIHILQPTSIQYEPRKALWLENHRIPLDIAGGITPVMKQSFKTYSAGAIIQSIQAMQQGRIEEMLVMPESFENKLIFIGTSAAGTHDNLAFSLGTNIPGVFFHASVADNILQHQFYTFASHWVHWGTVVFIILFSWGITFIFQRQMIIQIMGLSLVGGGFFCASVIGFREWLYVVPMATPLSGGILATISSYGYIALTEGKERKRMRQMLSKYVSPTVLTEVMDKSTEVLTPEVGAKESITILFSDIRSFTSISESSSVEVIVSLLNYYLSDMVDIIFNHHGTLDKFIGDAIMAFWGAPIKSNDHAFQAVCAALAMVDALPKINAHFVRQDWPSINFGIGIHSGKVILGNIGSSQHLDYTIIGDDVNLASRIEGLTKHYKSAILISEVTHNQLKDRILCRPIDCVQVKGKSTALTLYQPLALTHLATENQQALASLTELGMETYQSRDFTGAIGQFNQVLQLSATDPIATQFIKRSEFYLEHPPKDDWNGVYVFDTK